MALSQLLGFLVGLICLSCVLSDDDDTEEQLERLMGYACRKYAKKEYGWKVTLPGVCNFYIKCDLPKLNKCPDGHFFDGYACVESHLAQCYYDKCYQRNNGETYWDQENCYGYYKCQNEVSHYQKCYHGFRYSQRYGRCVSDSRCHSNVFPDPCYNKPDGATYGDPKKSCYGYNICLGGKSSFKKCYHGFRYTRNGCVPDSACHSNVLPPISACDENQYIASPVLPGLFFQRHPNGHFVRRKCPWILVFNTSICNCDWPKNYHVRKYKSGQTNSNSY